MTEGGTDGPAIIVSGGGTGIGAAIARALAADGAQVTVCGRTEVKLADTARRINDEVERAAVHWEVADVTVESDVERLVANAVERAGRLDGVVSNAGGGGGLGPLHLQRIADFQRVLNLNIVGALILAKYAVPVLARTGGGSFVGISSIAGHVTHRYFGAYTVAKAGLEEFIRNAADEYGPAKIRFNAVRPGLTSTEMMGWLGEGSPIYQSYDENTPLGAWSEASDIAELVRFLLSPAAARITAQIINVDGGLSLRRGPDYSTMILPGFGGESVALGLADPPSAPPTPG